MTRKKRYLFSYLLLALALVVLFAANLFWGSVALTPGAVLAALKAGTIQPSRHQSYLRLYEELKPLQEWQEKQTK